MTFLAISSIAAGLIFALVLAWFLARPLPQESLATRSEAPDGLLSEHAQHFPQLRHPLAGTDTPYVEHCTSPQIARHWRDDRQQALQNFLWALGEDFARLEQLAALAVAMTPEKSGASPTRSALPIAAIPRQLPVHFLAAPYAQPCLHPAYHQARRTPRKSFRLHRCTFGKAHLPPSIRVLRAAVKNSSRLTAQPRLPSRALPNPDVPS